MCLSRKELFMEQNKVNTNKEPLYWGDLLKLFAKKLKPILIIGLVFAILGGALGVMLASMNATCTAEIKLAVTPMDDSDRLLFNLRSGRFAETLLLEENGLPAKDKCDAEDYDAALKAIEAYEDARERRWNKYVETTIFHMNDIETTYKRLENEYTVALELLKMYKEADGEGFANNEDHLKMIAQCEEKLLAAEAAKKAYYNDYYLPADQTRVRLQAELVALKDEVDVTRRAADEAVEKVLAAWRNRAEVQEKVAMIMDSVTYEYITSNIPKIETPKDAQTINKGYIQVSITLLAEEEAFAEELVDAYRLHICDYAEKQLEFLSGSADVDCTLIDPIIHVECQADSPVGEAVKYALIAGLAAVVLVYLFFVLRMLAARTKDDHPAEENK